MKLSVGIITFNEENRIGKTIDAIKEIADEIIVVDSESRDRTVEIAKFKGAKVFVEKWKGYGPQKNSVLEKCRGEWILLLDADEVVSAELREKIKKIINSSNPSSEVYKIKLRNIAFGREIKFGGWDDYVIRLWKNGKVKISNREVHEKYQTQEKIEKIKELIIHYTYDSIEEFLEKLNRYTSQSAKEYIKTKLREAYYNTLGKDTSLVITTYNWPDALRLCLESVLAQTVLPHEIIVADDGSREETANLVRDFQISNPFVKIIHSWQEDKGFRAGMSRNKAIAKATGNYVIIIDGDLILERHFVQDHIEKKENGFFIQGSRVIISKDKSQKIINGEKLNLQKNFFDKNFKNKLNMIRNSILSKILTKKDKNLKGIRSCNMSFFKKDLELVNGFEEKIEGWGREDSELALRLFNNGIKKKKLKFSALTYHIFHKENDRSHLKENDKLLSDAIKNKKMIAEKGLNQYD